MGILALPTRIDTFHSVKRLRFAIEYALMRFAFFFVDRMSHESALRHFASMSRFWFRVDSRRRPITIRNILMAGVTKSHAEAVDIARASYVHFAHVMADSLKSDHILAGNGWPPSCSIKMSPELEELLRKPGQGIILASGHFGSWELGSQMLSMLKPLEGVTERMSNPLTHRYLMERKAKHNVRVIPKHDRSDAGRFLNVLKNGHILALMTDLYAVAGRGITTDFFGHPTESYTTAAILHLVTGAPICFGYILRTGDCQYEVHAEGPFVHKPTGDRQADVRAIIELINSRLEAAIRTHPSQYLWAYRRWR